MAVPETNQSIILILERVVLKLCKINTELRMIFFQNSDQSFRRTELPGKNVHIYWERCFPMDILSSGIFESQRIESVTHFENNYALLTSHFTKTWETFCWENSKLGKTFNNYETFLLWLRFWLSLLLSNFNINPQLNTSHSNKIITETTSIQKCRVYIQAD